MSAARDRHRPAYHYTVDNWINDPIPFYHDGKYHVFLQYNPDGAYWGNMHWAHAVSGDLMRWRSLPIALAPTPGGPDEKGVWTGCVVEHEGTFYAFYTGITPAEKFTQVQCVATSRDLIRWEKYAGNPILSEKSESGWGDTFRDPQLWKEDGDWYMVIGGERPNRQGGAAYLYRCKGDLFHWDYLGVLNEGNVHETGYDYECPDFFKLDEKHVLITSREFTFWQTGRYENFRFIPEGMDKVDSNAFYAAKSILDGKGRRLLWGWLKESRPVEEHKQAGWAGALSLPRVLTMRPGGTLGIEPADELKSLRGRHWRFENVELHPDGDEAFHLLDGVEGDQLEVVIRFATNDAELLGAIVRATPDLESFGEIVYDRENRMLGEVNFTLAPGEEMEMRIFIDHSVVESFVNGRACCALRLYPGRTDALRVGLLAKGRGPVAVKSVDVWDLDPAC